MYKSNASVHAIIVNMQNSDRSAFIDAAQSLLRIVTWSSRAQVVRVVSAFVTAI